MKFFEYIALATTAVALFVAPVGMAQAQSLQQTLSQAYENSPTLSSAFLAVRAAGQGIRSAEGGLLPTIGAQASLQEVFTFAPETQVTNPATGGQMVSGGASASVSDRIGLSYNQTLFDNYATDAGIRAAEATYEASAYTAVNTEQNVLLGAATAFYNVMLDRRIVTIRRENLGFVETQLSAARTRLELGEGTQLDLAQAQSAVAQATAAYQAATNNVAISEANYMRAVGIEPGNLREDMSIGAFIPASVDAALAAAERGHPALLASQAQIRAATAQAEQTIASSGPNVSFSAQAGVGGFISGTPASQVTLGLTLSVPIYSPTRDPAIEQANIGRMRTEVEAFATRDQVYEAVRQAWAGYSSANAQIQSATAAVAATRLALNAMLDQQDVGLATTLDVLDARSSLRSVEEQLASAQTQRAIAGFSLLSAMGVLSAESLGLPVRARAVDGTFIQPVAAQAPAPVDAWHGLR